MEVIEGEGKGSLQRILPTETHFAWARQLIRPIDPMEWDTSDGDDKDGPKEGAGSIVGRAIKDIATGIAEALWVEWGDELPAALKPRFYEEEEGEEGLRLAYVRGELDDEDDDEG